MREQAKIREPLQKQYKAALPDQVYDPEEQMALLTQFVQHQPLEGAKRVVLPSAEMANYQDMIHRHLPEHPFVRQNEFGNAVLGSTVLARAVFNGRQISHQRITDVSRQPFLWRSLAGLLRSSSLLDGSYVGHILNSFWNDPLSADVRLSTVYIRPSDEGSALVTVPALKGAAISFEATLPIKFYGRMKNCEIDVTGQIILEGTGARGVGKSFLLHGPIVLIADSVEIDSDSVN
jgi:hypothetical protein